ncbi:UNVERIFIED_CONTAM: hypothetical protein GTU68_052175 [Idotea baltica]|nr:hypothetical protein [Idotea baltica]
MHYRGSMARR